MMKKIPVFLLTLSCFSLFGQTNWQTYFEQSGGKKTPRYPETVTYCLQLAGASPKIHYTTFGVSPQGRDLPLLIIDRDGLTTPEAIKATGRIILLVEACIHPGESEGKDAGLMLARDLIAPPLDPLPRKEEGRGKKEEEKGEREEDQRIGYSAPASENKIENRQSKIENLLDHVSLLFIPIFNVDGHERFGPYNRINQNGPEEMGWRVTATNLNLNRDFLKADAPEMKAWLTMYNRWDPDFFIDIHTTDGADYQYVLTYMMETRGNMDAGLTTWCDSVFLPVWTDEMELAGYPVFPYIEFRRWHDPKSGLIRDVAPPMLSQGYVALRNRPGLLVETHMLKPYKQRVEATYHCLISTLGILNDQWHQLKTLCADADAFVQSESFRSQPFPLLFDLSRTDSVMVGFRGVEYEAVYSELTGGLWYQYSDSPVTFPVPLFEKVEPVKTVTLPEAYIIPVEWKEVIDRAAWHGISMIRLPRDSAIRVTSYRFSNPRWQTNPYEGRHPLTRVVSDTFSEVRIFPAGSVIIPVGQPSARVIAHLLEPNGNGSLLFWGFFDPVFEQKEYSEFYVMEPMAKKMLDEDPLLREEFETKMASDSTFATSQWQIMNWFLERSPYGDKRRMVYPVGRINN
ncbi:MAG: hypothetical protein JXA23_05550 [Bacteroidales bacterium]|nr:hypothetical protein [Bacteroidales bacterium]